LSFLVEDLLEYKPVINQSDKEYISKPDEFIVSKEGPLQQTEKPAVLIIESTQDPLVRGDSNQSDVVLRPEVEDGTDFSADQQPDEQVSAAAFVDRAREERKPVDITLLNQVDVDQDPVDEATTDEVPANKVPVDQSSVEQEAVEPGLADRAAQLPGNQMPVEGVALDPRVSDKAMGSKATQDEQPLDKPTQLAMLTEQVESKPVSEYVKRYIAAAESGNAKAQLSLAYMYETGEQVEMDHAAAVGWYQRAAENGEVQAMISLGVMYEHSTGIVQDLAESARWFRKAANLGDADSQQTLGYMYENGNGVVKDAAEAARWYEKAARQGRLAAQNNLGRLYQLGIGVEKNLDKAIFWYEQAAAKGSEAARKNLEDLLLSRAKG